MNGNAPSENFARLFAEHERRVYAYIFAILGDWAAAADVFQDTCVRMWTKFEDFQPGTDFGAWARRIAYYKILKYREQCRSQPFASQEFLDTVASACEIENDDEQRWLAILSECMKKLPPRDHRLITERYSEDCTIKELAARLGLSVHTPTRQ